MRVRVTREAMGWSQAHTAERVGVSQQRWNTYENSVALIPPQILGKFILITGATADWIYFGRMDLLPSWMAERIRQDDGESSAKA